MTIKAIGRVIEHYCKNLAIVATTAGIIGPWASGVTQLPLMIGSSVVTIILLICAILFGRFGDANRGVN